MVKSYPSLIMTIIFVLLILSYGITKLQVLISRSDYKIQINQIDDYLEPDYKLNLNQTNFKFAFAIVGDDEIVKDDPNYVRWLVRLKISKPNIDDTYEPVKTHYCTDKDWKQFYPPSKESASSIQKLKNLNKMICLNDD